MYFDESQRFNEVAGFHISIYFPGNTYVGLNHLLS